MPTLSSVTSFANNDPMSPSLFNAKMDVLVSNISLVNAASSATASSGLSGTGVSTYIPLWSGVTSLVTSIASQNGSVVGVAGIVSMTSYLVVNSSATTATAGTIRLSARGSIQARTDDNSANKPMIGHDGAGNRINVGCLADGTLSTIVGVNNDLNWITDGTYTIGGASSFRPSRMFVVDYYVVGNNAPSGSNSGAFRTNYRTDILTARNASDNSNIILWGVDSTNDIRQGTTLNSFDLVIKRPILQDYAEKTHAFGTISANTVASLESGPIFTATATSNISFQLVNAPASPNGGNASFWLTASGSTITFSFLSVNFGAQGTPAGIPNGTGMLVNTMTIDGGLTFRGSYTTGYT